MPEPVIIELRCNETAYKTDRPRLPYAPEEIVRDAVEAREAGASILHWHARDPASGEPDNDVELYKEVYRGVRENTDLFLHPTLGYITQMDVRERVRHVLAVSDDPALRVDLAPVDCGSVNVDYWDPQKKDFATKDLVYYNPRGRLEGTLSVFQKNGVRASAVCWNVGQMRTACCFREMGLLPEPTIWELVFTGEVMPEGTAPSMHALLAMVEQVPEGEPWTVICWNGDVTHLAAWAITLGGHVSIGLGDHHYDRFGTPTNADLVRRVAEMAETLGRPVATPGQTRELLGLPTPG
jgi:3-keto-5-aminohexanoate cleavage enzyme